MEKKLERITLLFDKKGEALIREKKTENKTVYEEIKIIAHVLLEREFEKAVKKLTGFFAFMALDFL